MKIFERIIKEDLLLRTAHLLDKRQHGFLNNKSCTTNMIGFSDSIALSIDDCNVLSTDVIYFDFSKAFDSVNHDILLKKLKTLYGTDGRMLKFLMNYLSGRQQCVIIENIKSSSMNVLSGVPQGSILGPILFLLFINDLAEGIDSDTNLDLYADDTKIWRKIMSDEDFVKLQKDIDLLMLWSIKNKMHFHLGKCKVVSIKNRPSPMSMLPFMTFYYHLGDKIISFEEREIDLGVVINCNFSFNEQCEQVISKANQQYGILRRNCHFINDIKRKKILYLARVRSQFEHCAQIWRPTNKSMVTKFENVQKKCIKWILNEEEYSYNSSKLYNTKCKQVNLLPLLYRFDLNDLVLFHKIFHRLIPVSMPYYLSLFSGNQLRTSHFDCLCFVSSILPSGNSTRALNKSFFYRTHSLWNTLPIEIRRIRL